MCVRSFKHSAELNWKRVDEHTTLRFYLHRPTALGCEIARNEKLKAFLGAGIALSNSTLALTASRPSSQSHDNVCLHRGEPLVGFILLVNYFDLCRFEGSHVTAAAALHALATPPPVLADAAAAAVLALAVLPAVLADAFAAALLAVVALPPVLADAAAAALLAGSSQPPVLADTAAAALLAIVALPSVPTDASTAALLADAAPPPVLAEAAATALLAGMALPPVLADAATTALLALGAPPPMLTDATAAALLAGAALPPVLADVFTATLLAGTALPPVFADAAAAALLAGSAHPLVLADAFAAAVLADVALPAVRTGRHDSRPRRALRAVHAPNTPPLPPCPRRQVETRGLSQRSYAPIAHCVALLLPPGLSAPCIGARLQTRNSRLRDAACRARSADFGLAGGDARGPNAKRQPGEERQHSHADATGCE